MSERKYGMKSAIGVTTLAGALAVAAGTIMIQRPLKTGASVISAATRAFQGLDSQATNVAPTRREYHKQTIQQWMNGIEAESNIFKQAGMKPYFFFGLANLNTDGLENMRTDLRRVEAYLKEKNNGLSEADKTKITDQIKTLNTNLDAIGMRLTREGSNPGFREDASPQPKENHAQPRRRQHAVAPLKNLEV